MRKNIQIIVTLACLSGLGSRATGDLLPQPQLEFSKSSSETFNADWQGVAGRTYFTQFSTDLVNWTYAPFIDFGLEAHQRGVSSNNGKFFLRLHYGDFPGINNLDDAMNADQDGDGLSNIFEVTHGYDPFDIESTMDGEDVSHDPDEDGLGNATEQASGTDPMNKDNSLLQLEVIVD